MSFTVSLPISQQLAAALELQFPESYVLGLVDAPAVQAVPETELAASKIFWAGLRHGRLELAGPSDSQVILSILCHLGELNEAETIDAFVSDIKQFGAPETHALFRAMTATDMARFGREVGAVAGVASHYWHLLCAPDGGAEMRSQVEKWGSLIGRFK